MKRMPALYLGFTGLLLAWAWGACFAPVVAVASDAEHSLAAYVLGQPPAAEAREARFGFASVLGQVATSVQIVATSVDGVPLASAQASSVRQGQQAVAGAPPPSPKNVSVRPGQEVVFTVSGALQSAASSDVVVLFDSALTYETDGGDCYLATSGSVGNLPAVRPASLGGVLECFPVPFGINQPFNFEVVFQVNANATSRVEANFVVACVEGSPVAGNFNLCDSVAGTVVGAPTPTPRPLAVAVVVPPPLPLPPLAPPPPPLPALAPPPPVGPPAHSPPVGTVPIIPEADSLLLLAGGLGAVALAVAWRTRRRQQRRRM